MIVLLILFVLLLFFYYHFLEQRENKFVESVSNQLGIYYESITLSHFSINGRDKLHWGLKLYLYNKGMVISSFLSNSPDILIAFKDIKRFNINGKFVNLYCYTKDLHSQVKFELSSGPFDKNLADIINQKILTYHQLKEVEKC